MKKFSTFVKEAAVNPQSNLTKKQRQALASPAARAKPKDQVTLAKMPWDKDKKKDEDVNEISKDMVGRYLKKTPASAADAADKIKHSYDRMKYDKEGGDKLKKKSIRNFVNRHRGVSMATDKLTGKAKVSAEATEEGIVNTLATKVAKKTRDPNTIRRLTHKAASAVANATDGKEKKCD